MLVKLCGFSEIESLKTAISCSCDFIGFIFHQNSPRNVSLSQAKSLGKIIPSSIAKVAVTVDADFDLLKQIDNHLKPQFFQLHGQEDEEYLKKTHLEFPHIKIIKALPISKNEDFEILSKYQNLCNYFLFDSKVENNFGGSGLTLDWKLFNDKIFTKDWFLSGGLNAQNIKQAILQTGAKMIDVSSGIEEIKGKKSSKLIKEFMAVIKDQNVN